MENATTRTRQRDNAVITSVKVTLQEGEAMIERLFPTAVRFGPADPLMSGGFHPNLQSGSLETAVP